MIPRSRGPVGLFYIFQAPLQVPSQNQIVRDRRYTARAYDGGRRNVIGRRTRAQGYSDPIFGKPTGLLPVATSLSHDSPRTHQRTTTCSERCVRQAPTSAPFASRLPARVNQIRTFAVSGRRIHGSIAHRGQLRTTRYISAWSARLRIFEHTISGLIPAAKTAQLTR
jgi:hypothetical protein